ncbi:MAG: SNF2-related protein [Lachnospiraceae bacterium]|nr:SNF2-related protein [Lachnospiraceae bacterium]
MKTYLHISANLLTEWLCKFLPKATPDWWEDCVMDKLTYTQRETAKRKGFTNLKEFDLASLLRIADKSWYAMREIVYLSTQERECIRNMMRVRNNWAHCSTVLPGKDAIIEDLDTLHRFFEQMGCDGGLVNEVEQMAEAVKSSSMVDFDVLLKEGSGEEVLYGTDAENEIAEKSLVYLVGDPTTRGIVMSITDIGDTKKYDVFVDGQFKTYYSGQIAPVAETDSCNWVDINTFRSYLTAYQINNPSNRDLYSLNSARIDFVPYQFRPALKLIHADEPRILIADSVGVGKTIEAGLIIKELQARSELENILIICPKPLVAERKWELEMKRFDEEFIPVTGSELRQIISDTDRDGEWPVRYSKTIVPYSVLDGRTYHGDTGRKSTFFGLKGLDPAPHFDLVIVDEAHHIRNGSMEKEKAFEYKCVKYFCDHADAVVMLTATPLQTKDDDLFTLLNVLRPDVFFDKPAFNLMARPNAHISAASSLIRKAAKNWQEQAVRELEGVLETQWGENVIAVNPAYASILQILQQEKITREERVRLISDVESLHSFHSMLNRTRRKDIQDFCIRRPFTLAVEFTPAQQALHDELLRFEQNALMQLHGDARSIPFMMSTIKRQAASCIFGLAPHIRDLIRRRFVQMDGDSDSEMPGFEFSGTGAGALEELAQNLLQMADSLPEEDPKFDQMMTVIREKQAAENNKIIIFSTFRFTLGYLKEKLIKAGFRVDQVDGSVKDAVRQDLRARFELPKSDPEALDILLFTEVGSEGLDYQFCNMMINYDLPWNPMKIEQRIGRIDRRGQKSEAVSIYNVITNGTVDADIYYRCLMRIGIFESSIGECEEILGEIAERIDQIVVVPTLTEEERKIKLEQMADNEVRKIQEMNRLEEEEKEFFGFDLSEYMTSQEIHKAENPWLSQKNLQIMIEQYMEERLGKGTYFLGESDVKQLRLSATARELLREDFRKLPAGRNAVRRSWDIYLKGKNPMHPVTFDSEAAEKNRDAFFITAMHPLARQAAEYYNLNKQAYIRVQYANDDLPTGTYYFSVYAWSYVGLNPHFRLMIICDNDIIADELPDILQESQNGAPAVKMLPSDWDALEKKHVKLWMEEKRNEVKEAENAATFKIESLTNNFRNLQRTLEQKIIDTASESIQRMYTGELESARERYEVKVQSIRQQVAQADIHTTLIANGILEIV